MGIHALIWISNLTLQGVQFSIKIAFCKGDFSGKLDLIMLGVRWQNLRISLTLTIWGSYIANVYIM